MRPHGLASPLVILAFALLAVPARSDEPFDPAAPSWSATGARAVASRRSELLLSLAALALPGGFGAFATLSVPLERIAAPGKVASYTYSPSAPIGIAGPDAARDAVAAAWRVAGLAHGESALDSMAARARWSALLPEARVRVLKRATDATHVTGADPETGTWYGSGDALLVEGRLTWRLDRLVFADEEPSIERIRLERAEARMRVAARTLDLLSKWQRAMVDVSGASPGTADHTDALLRGVEAACALDVLTDGWFSRWREGRKPEGDGAH